MRKKLALNELKVNSFVTDLSKNNEHTIKGGTATTAAAVSIVAYATCYVINGILSGNRCYVQIEYHK